MLSKSRILRGHKCEKSLYLYARHPELKDPITEQQQMKFDQGKEVGKLACQLFPGGKYGTAENGIPGEKGIQNTTQLITNGEEVIYEATFTFDDILVAVDILVKQDDGWKIYEVKSATSVKDINIVDVATQQYVLEGNGLNIKRVFVVHLNNQYIRGNTLDIQALFIKADTTDEAAKLLPGMSQRVNDLKKILYQNTVPDIDIGPQCNEHYPCDFEGHCWQHIPEPSVFDIKRLYANKKFDLYNTGIIEYHDIPEDYKLNDKQRLQVESYLNNTTHINEKAIQKYCADISYPLYFFDFESFQSHIPLYKNSHAYQQIPFQYSIHYKESANSEVEHFEFLGQPGEDPRPEIINRMIQDLGNEGDIFTFHATFEKTRINELATDFPDYAPQLENIIARIKDLQTPFASKDYYTPAMKGKSSIKLVLPALVPEQSYDEMDIGSGDAASTAYLQLQKETDPDKIKKIREDLLEYCKLDTYAMVRIWGVLEGI